MRALKLLRSIAVNRLGGVPKPSWCTYATTFRCNARCKMCDSWYLPKQREMNVSEVERVFQPLGRLDVVRLTGGEPFLRKDLTDLAETVMRVSRPLVVHITTNGSFPDAVVAFAEQFSEPRRLAIMVSLDGLEETHDGNRGKAATFARAWETLTRLATIRDRLRFRLSVNHTVISEASMDDAHGLRDRCAEWGIELQTVVAYESSAIYGAGEDGPAEDLIMGNGYPLSHALPRKETAAFVGDEVRRCAQIGDLAMRYGKRFYLSGLHDRLLERPSQAGPRCVALRSHIRILPGGQVPVCQFNTEVVGNLLEEPFERVWNSVRAAELRGWVDRCPGCWAECEVIPNIIYSGAFLGVRG